MNLYLQPLGPELARRIALGEWQAEIVPDALTPIIREVATAHHWLYNETGATEPWIAYLAREGAGHTSPVVGVCSFKRPPQDGIIEIAYFTFPDHEGRGVGSSMTAALLEIASRHPDVSEVTAQTVPEVNASTRILKRMGFEHLGSGEDPEDGPVWRWSRRLR